MPPGKSKKFPGYTQCVIGWLTWKHKGGTKNWQLMTSEKRSKSIASECQNEWKLQGEKKGQAALSHSLLWARLSGNRPVSALLPWKNRRVHSRGSPRPCTEGDLKFQGVESLGCFGSCPKKPSGKINMPPGRLTKWWKIPDCYRGKSGGRG